MERGGGPEQDAYVRADEAGNDEEGPRANSEP